ncbi:hypothetical protein [Lignipirellula cremea]|uniref:Uncharacterized protein n=1 Tax=Lignipirellula cremea TaxID=2528010 RepID=A0A518E3P5_9BACT|nr:hypothetical protein [Lignipirellula cremea]QDU98692.1 hypothetical protein Pla8534_65650 [Lignipirellula cremea]
MWTEEDALKFINEEQLPISEMAFGRKYKVQVDLTESWANGWVFYLSSVEDEVSEVDYVPYVVEKHLEKCEIVGSRGLRRTIEDFYRQR